MMWEAVCVHVHEAPPGSLGILSFGWGPSGFLPTFCNLGEWWLEMPSSRRFSEICCLAFSSWILIPNDNAAHCEDVFSGL